MLTISRYELSYKILIGYLYVAFFGGWVLRLAGFSNELGLMLLSGLDILPLGVWILSNPRLRVKTKDFFVDTLSFWVCWLVVLLALMVSSYLHGGSVVSPFVHWGALVRYVPLAYAVVALWKYIDVADRIVKHLKYVAIIILSITYLSILLGEGASIFHPVMSKSSTAARELVNGSYAAVYANTIDLGFLLVILYSIFAYKTDLSRTRLWIITLLFVFATYKTGSAIATFGITVIAFYRLTERAKLVRYSIIVAFCIVASVLAYIYWDLIELLIDNVRLSRLGILTNTFPDFLSEFSFDTFFGVGNDGYVVLDKVNSYPNKVYLLAAADDGNISAFGDVYWVALLVYHGVLGVALLSYIYYKLYESTANRVYVDSKFDYNRIIKWIFFVIILFAFLNQVIVVKTFALVFWLFLAVVYTKVKTDESTANQ